MDSRLRGNDSTRKGFLKGLVQVSRMANTATIVSAPTEDDYPAAALGPDGRLYVAYVAFTHGQDFQKRLAARRAQQ